VTIIKHVDKTILRPDRLDECLTQDLREEMWFPVWLNLTCISRPRAEKLEAKAWLEPNKAQGFQPVVQHLEINLQPEQQENRQENRDSKVQEKERLPRPPGSYSSHAEGGPTAQKLQRGDPVPHPQDWPTPGGGYETHCCREHLQQDYRLRPEVLHYGRSC